MIETFCCIRYVKFTLLFRLHKIVTKFVTEMIFTEKCISSPRKRYTEQILLFSFTVSGRTLKFGEPLFFLLPKAESFS